MKSALGRLSCLAVLLLAVVLPNARAQYAIAYSGLLITPTTVTGVAYTQPDYMASLYYDAKVDGYLYRGGSLIGSDSDVNYYGCAIASVDSPFVMYTTFQMEADHWVRFYYWEYIESTIVYEDSYGFSLMSNPAPPYGGYYEYDPPGYYAQEFYEDEWLGATAIEARTWPPVLTGLNVLGSTMQGESGVMQIPGSDLGPWWGMDGGLKIDGTGVSFYYLAFYPGWTGVDIHYTISADAPPGPRNLWFQTMFGSSNTVQFAVEPPSVQSLEYLSDTGYVNATSGTIYVAVGTTVSFRASPSPPAQVFPSGYPVWSGTSGASGTGSSVSVTFNTVSSSISDFKTVSASTTNTLTANVVVFDFNLLLTPYDNFQGRSLTRFGVGEVMSLNYTTSPSINHAYAGSPDWQEVSGGGYLRNYDLGGATYYVAGSPGAFTLELRIRQGPSKDRSKQQTASIVAPTGGYQVQMPGTSIWHIQGMYSIGHWDHEYILPEDVSFSRIRVRESSCYPTVTGWLTSFSWEMHPVGAWALVAECNASSGCRWQAHHDESAVSVAAQSSWGVGSLSWNIPRQYQVLDKDDHWGSEQTFMFMLSYKTSDAAGTATSIKGGAGPFSRALNDPTSNYQ